MGYKVWVPPTKFEGEAELKHLHENVYVGGYGIRSEKETYQWMGENFNMQVVKLRLTDPYRRRCCGPCSRGQLLQSQRVSHERGAPVLHGDAPQPARLSDCSYRLTPGVARRSKGLHSVLQLHEHEPSLSRRVEGLAAGHPGRG